MTIQTKDNYEPRNCFKEHRHEDHVWDVPADDGSTTNNNSPRVLRYYCDGGAPRPAGWESSIPLEGHPAPIIIDEQACFVTGVHERHVWNSDGTMKVCPGLFPEEIQGIDETDPDQRLGKQADLLASRRKVYGDTVDNMKRTALIWSGITGQTIEPWHVPLMFSTYKNFRSAVTPDYSDNIDDAEGYEGMFREVVEALFPKGMVQARTVEEYLNIRYDGEQERVIEVRVPVNENRPHVVGCVLRDEHSGKCEVKGGYVPRHPYDRDFSE